MDAKPVDEDFSPEERARRRDVALKRAMSMPPSPRSKSSPKKKAATRKSRRLKSNSRGS